MRAFVSLLIVILLAGCSSDPVRVGSKNLAESRILAEMFALLLEEDGVPVKRMPSLGATGVVYQALIDDDIDLYPEYTGTALAFMGARSNNDADEAMRVASEGLARNGLVLLDRLGFETDYVVLTRPAIAVANGLDDISDLAGADDRLRLGITQSFAERPRDGLEPFLDRFGLTFEDIEVFSETSREGMYDALLERSVDIIVGLSTDPEISDYELVALSDATGFFPVYQAAPLTSDLALERTPDIAAAMQKLAGRIDDDMMRSLNAAVRLDGRPVNRVARQALYDLGLVAKPPRERTPVLAIAMGPETIGTDAGIETLRAVRKSMRGRDVNLLSTNVPLAAMANGEARLALTPALSGFTMTDGRMIRDERVEAVAAIGSTFLHVLTRSDDRALPEGTLTIATGPEGSASHTLALAVARNSDRDIGVLPLDELDAQTAAAALRDGDADLALIFAARGRQDMVDLFARSDDVTLADVAGLWTDADRLSMPVMREAQIAAGTYAGIDETVETLSTQMILFGPATSDRFLIGQQGPNAFFDEPRPLQDKSVEAINRNLGLHAAVDPHLRRAAALTPEVSIRDDRINPYPGRAILLIAILGYLVWAGWLFVRPERKGER
ncbi:glycine betaine ABC transporter substrate-binding protein [Martelella sp. AMO21009]